MYCTQCVGCASGEFLILFFFSFENLSKRKLVMVLSELVTESYKCMKNMLMKTLDVCVSECVSME